MLEKTFDNPPEVYTHSQSAYSQPRFVFNSDSEIKSCQNTQQEDPASPVSFADSIQDLIDRLESKKTPVVQQ